MQIIKKISLSVCLIALLQTTALASEIIQPPDAYRQIKGRYILASAEGERKSYCDKNITVKFARTEYGRQIYSIAIITPRILLPLANFTKSFNEADKCTSVQAIRLYNRIEPVQIALEEQIDETCPKKANNSSVRTLLDYNPATRKLTYEREENGSRKIQCVWKKK